MNCTFPLALTFLTKLPWPWPGEATSADLARSLFWFPWVGAMLGLIFLGAWSILRRCCRTRRPRPCCSASPSGSPAASTWTAWRTPWTAWAAAGTPKRRRRIMKDSRVGAFGVLGLILILLLKFAFFLAAADKGWRGQIILFPVLSRWGMVYLAYCSDYARPEGGLGQAMTTGVSPRVAAGANLSTIILAILLLGLKGLGPGPRL